MYFFGHEDMFFKWFCFIILNNVLSVCQIVHSKKYGKIFKSRFGPQLVVSVADRDLVAEVLRAEGVAPQRANMESWHEYRNMRKRSNGLISA